MAVIIASRKPQKTNILMKIRMKTKQLSNKSTLIFMMILKKFTMVKTSKLKRKEQQSNSATLATGNLTRITSTERTWLSTGFAIWTAAPLRHTRKLWRSTSWCSIAPGCTTRYATSTLPRTSAGGSRRERSDILVKRTWRFGISSRKRWWGEGSWSGGRRIGSNGTKPAVSFLKCYSFS